MARGKEEKDVHRRRKTISINGGYRMMKYRIFVYVHGEYQINITPRLTFKR